MSEAKPRGLCITACEEGGYYVTSNGVALFAGDITACVDYVRNKFEPPDEFGPVQADRFIEGLPVWAGGPVYDPYSGPSADMQRDIDTNALKWFLRGRVGKPVGTPTPQELQEAFDEVTNVDGVPMEFGASGHNRWNQTLSEVMDQVRLRAEGKAKSRMSAVNGGGDNIQRYFSGPGATERDL